MTIQLMLQRVNAGETNFKPSSDKDPDILAFQLIAKLLEEANREGLLRGYLAHRESESANNWYDAVFVEGLSDKGISYLLR